MHAQHLALTLGRKLDRRDTVDHWRAGMVYRWSPVAERWLECCTEPAASIRPGVSLTAIERDRGGLVAVLDD